MKRQEIIGKVYNEHFLAMETTVHQETGKRGDAARAVRGPLSGVGSGAIAW